MPPKRKKKLRPKAKVGLSDSWMLDVPFGELVPCAYMINPCVLPAELGELRLVQTDSHAKNMAQ